MHGIGRTLLLVGLAVALAGAVLLLVERLGWPRVPGDLTYRGRGWTVYLPLGTSLLLSVLLTLVLWVLRKR
jgi:hypothetical protein